MEERQIMAEIKKAMEQGLHEVKIEGVIIKLPRIDGIFDKHIAPWEK
ncbi:hypothetical protein ACFLZB_03675 [Nanoarchaeota archaeon]